MDKDNIVTKVILPEEYKEMYREAGTWGDLDSLNDKLTDEQIESFLTSLQVVNEYTGLDMRQEWLVGCLKALKKIRQKGKD